MLNQSQSFKAYPLPLWKRYFNHESDTKLTNYACDATEGDKETQAPQQPLRNRSLLLQ